MEAKNQGTRKNTKAMITLDIRKSKTEKEVVTTENSVYIQMGDYTYYFDNSKGETIVQRWLTDRVTDLCLMEEPIWEEIASVLTTTLKKPLYPNVVYKEEGWASWGETKML
jgi:hypothetical protein